MEESDLDRELVDVAGEIVVLSLRDRDALLQELCVVPGSRTIREKFEAAGEHRSVKLDGKQLSELRVALEAWTRKGVPPDGVARLLAALVRADPGGGVGIGVVDG